MPVKHYYQKPDLNEAEVNRRFQKLRNFPEIVSFNFEFCFNVEIAVDEELSEDEEEKLKWIIRDSVRGGDSEKQQISGMSGLSKPTSEHEFLIEIGPRYSPFSAYAYACFPTPRVAQKLITTGRGREMISSL